MPRQKRVDEARMIYHAINRGNARNSIFHKSEDYDALLRVLAEGLEKYQVDLFSFVLMPNHWHLVLRPGRDGEMGKLLRWVTATHSLRYHAHYHTREYGHIYQSRFKSFPIQDDTHFYVVCRYVERNPLRANLVPKAELWPYGSLYRWNQTTDSIPKVLEELVRSVDSIDKAIHRATTRPWEPSWHATGCVRHIGKVRKSVRRLGLESS